MLPITISFFLKQAENKQNRPLVLATVYTLTIITVLTLGAVVLLETFQQISQESYTNFILGGLFIFFALSLFGMYEIRLPSRLATFTSIREGQGGIIGTVFMALTFTIISFSCVAPFMGGFAGIAVQERPFWQTILGGLAFSATFASPFFFLALFPSLLKSLPKSGSWLNTVKVVMGFLELAAALKFLRAGELLVLDEAEILTYEFTLGMYIAISFMCGIYLLGLFRTPHDTPNEHLGVPRLLFAFMFLSLGFYLTPGLFKVNEDQQQFPRGAIFAWLDSFLLPDEGSRLPWGGNLAKAIKEAEEGPNRKLVFIDFTGKT
jgi:thiol:disulfide interchange protein DsbD